LGADLEVLFAGNEIVGVVGRVMNGLQDFENLVLSTFESEPA
jgi:hypothetical protein